MMSMIFHMTFTIAIGFIFFAELEDGFRWVALVWAIFGLLVFIEVTVLAIFHCYISFWLYKTTLQVLQGNKVENKDEEKKKTIVVSDTIKVEERAKEEREEPTQMALNK